MTTSIYIDPATKSRASKKAKKDQLSFSAVIRILLSDYADGRIEIGTRTKETYEIAEIPVDAATQKKMDAISTKWHKLKK